MKNNSSRVSHLPVAAHSHVILTLLLGVFLVSSCSPKAAEMATDTAEATSPKTEMEAMPSKADAMQASKPTRVGLKSGLFDAGEAIWNLELLSETPPPQEFVGVTNSDLAFKGPYAIQGNYNGMMVWDISTPENPSLEKAYVCPASQSDVSVYENLLFVSGEGLSGRLDCGTEGVQQAISQDRLRGIRIFDITDITDPKYVANVQTCRGSHTHSVLKDPDDDENVYVYVSGSAPVRPAEELPGCSGLSPDEDPNTALFRIEVIKVPLANPEAAAIVSSPRIFDGLVEPPSHGLAPDDLAAVKNAEAMGKFIVDIRGQKQVLPDRYASRLLGQMVQQRGGSGEPTAADSVALKEALPSIIAQMIGDDGEEDDGSRPGPTQCHDITLYPELGLAGGACEGYGLLLDISDPENPTRLSAVADSNFAYWHSATFNNDGTQILFTDEWGGGGQPKCRATDPKEWGANAIFSLQDNEMVFESYFKIDDAQTPEENCVAHNGSLIPIPGRDIMVQSWYQGGISVFDWTDPKNAVEIAYHDRGPVNPNQMEMGGSWSVYWYNGLIVSSEIARGLDIFKLAPSKYLSSNEIAASETVVFDYLNAQGQPSYTFPPSIHLSRAYVDQLERSGGLPASRIAAIRAELKAAESAGDSMMKDKLSTLASQLMNEVGSSSDGGKVEMLVSSLKGLAGM